MPTAPARGCSQCGQLNCKTHRRPAFAGAHQVKRITGTRLQRLRRQLFDRSPLCVLCLQMDPPRYTIATVREHRLALALGGTDTEDNVQSTCVPCNKAKAELEAQLGRRRTR